MNETPRVSLQKRFERNYPLLWTNLSRLNGLAIDLNKFSPNEKKVEISSIFKWFKQDFDQAGGVQKILGRYAPEPVREFAATGNYETKYLPYSDVWARDQRVSLLPLRDASWNLNYECAGD